MKKYKQVYMNFFELSGTELVPCERCWKQVAVDIHHCQHRGMGGNKNLDVIENLIGVCRDCHDIVESDRDENRALTGYCAQVNIRKQEMRKAMYCDY